MSDLSALCDVFGSPEISDGSRPVHPMDPYDSLRVNHQGLLDHMAMGRLRPNGYHNPESVVSTGVDGTAYLPYSPCPTGDRFISTSGPLSFPPGLAELSSALISNQHTQDNDDPLTLFPELQGSSDQPFEPVELNGAFQPISVNTGVQGVPVDTVVVPHSTDFFLDADFFEPTIAATNNQTSSGNPDLWRRLQVSRPFPDSARGLVSSDQVLQPLIDQFVIDQVPVDSAFTPAHGEFTHRGSLCGVGASHLPDLPVIPEELSPPTFCDVSPHTELNSQAQPYFPQLPEMYPDNGEKAPVSNADLLNLFAALSEPPRGEHKDPGLEEFRDIWGDFSPARVPSDSTSVFGSSLAMLPAAGASSSMDLEHEAPMGLFQGKLPEGLVLNENDHARRRDDSVKNAHKRGRKRTAPS